MVKEPFPQREREVEENAVSEDGAVARGLVSKLFQQFILIFLHTPHLHPGTHHTQHTPHTAHTSHITHSTSNYMYTCTLFIHCIYNILAHVHDLACFFLSSFSSLI